MAEDLAFAQEQMQTIELIMVPPLPPGDEVAGLQVQRPINGA
jgi:hypothetical protein